MMRYTAASPRSGPLSASISAPFAHQMRLSVSSWVTVTTACFANSWIAWIQSTIEMSSSDTDSSGPASASGAAP